MVDRGRPVETIGLTQPARSGLRPSAAALRHVLAKAVAAPTKAAAKRLLETAVAIARMSAIDRFCLDRCMAVSRFGIAMAARMPMIATTIRSSMRVKPFCFLVIRCPPCRTCLNRNRDTKDSEQ